MNKKGEVNIGIIITLFMALIVGLVLIQSTAQQVGTATNLVTVANQSIGVIQNNSVVYLTNYKSISGVVIYNDTNSVVANTEYAVANNVIYNGQEAVRITVDADDGDDQTGNEWFVSGTAQPLGYIPEGSGRSIAGLIVILSALALVGVVLYPVLREAEIFGVFK